MNGFSRRPKIQSFPITGSGASSAMQSPTMKGPTGRPVYEIAVTVEPAFFARLLSELRSNHEQ